MPVTQGPLPMLTAHSANFLCGGWYQTAEAIAELALRTGQTMVNALQPVLKQGLVDQVALGPIVVLATRSALPSSTQRCLNIDTP